MSTDGTASDMMHTEDRPHTAGTEKGTADLEVPHTPQEKEAKADDSENGAVADEKPSTDEYPHGLRLITLVGAVMLTVFLTSLDQTIVGTAIPKITDEFHGLSQVSWYGSAYFMCYGGFQSSWGKAYKFFPLKLTFMTSVLLFEVGSLICGVAPNSNALIAGRAIAALGGAGVTTGGTVIFAFCAEPKNRPMLMGLMGFSYTIAAILGPIIGGAFSERVTWRWCFYINLPLGGFSLSLIMLFFRTPSMAKVVQASFTEKIRQLDLIGIALAMGGIISYILAVQYGGQAYAWNSSVVIGLLVGAFVILVALAVWDYFQGDYAMLPRRLLGQRALWAPSAFQFFYSGCYFLLLYYLPIYFQSIKGVGAIQSGVDNLALVIAGCLAMLLGGMIVTSTRLATPFMVGGAAITTVGCGLLYTLNIDTPAGKWIGYQILLGVAIAFPFQNGLNIAQAHIAASDVSTATATLFFFQVVGGAFSVSAAQSAFVNRMTATLATYAPGVDPALVVATGATQLRTAFPADQLHGILLAYMEGIKATFAIAIALSGVAFILSFFCPWSRLPSGSAGGAVPAA